MTTRDERESLLLARQIVGQSNEIARLREALKQLTSRSRGEVMSITTDTGLTLEVVGKRPTNQPYLRITDADGEYIGSLDEAGMVALRDAITAARPSVDPEEG